MGAFVDHLNVNLKTVLNIAINILVVFVYSNYTEFYEENEV